MLKKLSWIIALLLFGTLIIYTCIRTDMKAKFKEKAKVEEYLKKKESIDSAIFVLKTKWNADDNWIESLLDLEKNRNTLNPVLTVELENILVNDKFIFAICELKDIERIDEKFYKVNLLCRDYKNRYLHTKIYFSLITIKEVIDPILKKPELFIDHEYQNTLAVIASIQEVKSKSDDETTNIKVGLGYLNTWELVNIK